MNIAISHTSQPDEIKAEPIDPIINSLSELDRRPSSVVKRERSANLSSRRTIARSRNGMSGDERKMLTEAIHRMRRAGRSLIHITVEAHDASEHEVRRRIARVKADFGQIQVRAGDPRHMVEVLESSPNVHAHITGPTPKGHRPEHIIVRLKRSKVYGDGIEGGAVYDAAGLVNYLCKEATTQARYAACNSFRRNKGSHKLGDGGGDRVRLSKQLEADLLGEGIIERRTRTYRKRLKPPSRDLVEAHQLLLFPQLGKPVSRIHDFSRGIAPPTVSLELEFHRKRRGLTQAQLASLIGISRPQLANFTAGRFGLAPWPAARLREALAA
jgi:hypothetical protein